MHAARRYLLVVGLLCGGVLLIIICLVHATRGTETRAHDEPAPSLSELPATSPSSLENTTPSTVPTESRSGQRALPTREDILREYWGPEWERVRELALEEGIDLSAPVLSPPPAWEDIRGEVAEHLLFSERDRETMHSHFDRQPATMTAEYLAAHYDTEDMIVNEALLAAVNSHASELHWEVEQAIDDYCAAIAAALAHIWDTGKFAKGPFFSGEESQVVPAAKIGALSYKGWGVSWVVRTDEHPYLKDLQKAGKEAVFERNRKLQDYIHSLR